MRYADLERAKELALPPAPQQALPWLTGLSPSAAVVVKRTTGAKLGHAMLDVASALLIAGAMNWSFIPPGRDSLDLWKVFDFRHLKPNLSLHGEGQSSSTWESAGACPRNWTIISFRHVFGWTGEPSWAKTVSYMRRKTERESGPMCIVCQGSVRVMLHHYRSWELYGMVRHGVYAAVTRALRAGLRTRFEISSDRGSSPAHSPHGSEASRQRISVVLHARRSDPSKHRDGTKTSIDWKQDVHHGKDTSVVAATIWHLGRAWVEAGDMHETVLDATVCTETARKPSDLRNRTRGALPLASWRGALHGAAAALRAGALPADLDTLGGRHEGAEQSLAVASGVRSRAQEHNRGTKGVNMLHLMAREAHDVDDPNDVWTHGCPSDLPNGSRTKCRVQSGTLLDDLRRFVDADIFVMAPSSLSYLAAYLREAEQRLTLVAISRRFLTPAEFWMFYSADDAFLPPNLYFINGTDTADTVSRLHGVAQLNQTIKWLTPLTRRKHTHRVAAGRSSTFPAPP